MIRLFLFRRIVMTDDASDEKATKIHTLFFGDNLKIDRKTEYFLSLERMDFFSSCKIRKVQEIKMVTNDLSIYPIQT